MTNRPASEFLSTAAELFKESTLNRALRHIGAVLIDRSSGRVLDATKPAIAWLGYESEIALIGKSMDVLIPAEYRGKHRIHVEKWDYDPHAMGGRRQPVLKRDGTIGHATLIPIPVEDDEHVLVAIVPEQK